MAPQTSNPWTTDPEYIDILNFLIERTENVQSPMNILRFAREYREKSVYSQTEQCIQKRIKRVGTIICSFEHIDTKTKVKMLFALSASVNPEFLKELKKDALVEVDQKNRITFYKAKDNSLEMRGEHSRSAKARTAYHESKCSFRSLILSYFEKKNDDDAVPTNEEEEEMWRLIEFIIAKCDKVDSPQSISRLAEDFVEKFRTSMTSDNVRTRIKGYRLEIQRMEFVDTRSKVQQLFGLSAAVNSDCLEKLRKNAHVEVDEKSRIVHYKANDGSIELRGDHSQSAKTKTAKLKSERSFHSLIRNYFEKKNNADAVPKNKEEKEIWNLIQLITEKCENVNSPLNITQFSKDFNKRFGSSRSFDCIYDRTKRYCHEIQKAEFLDTLSKVKQLFGLGARLDSSYLEKLRKDAVVEVDILNRITKYTANNGSLTLNGDHSRSAKRKLNRIVKRKSKKSVKKYCNSNGDKSEESERENEYSEEDSDECSSEEFGSEFDSDDENGHLDETEDLTQSSNEIEDFDNKTPVRNRSPTEMPIADNHWRTDPDYIDLLNFLIERTENVESPMSILRFAREFYEKIEYSQTQKCLEHRIRKFGVIIHSFEHIDTKTKVKMQFALSAPVDANFLEKLKEDALVEVDQKNRIVFYKANDGSLELRGEHSRSAKARTAYHESKCSFRSLINSYFQKKNNADAVPINEEEKEMWNLIEFIIAKCDKVDSPQSISRLAEDFVEKFQTSIPSDNVRTRINGYGLEIQRMKFVDTRSKVQQLFGLSAAVNSDCLEKLRKSALVEVDEKSRIVHYKANDGSIELRGDHSQSAKMRTAKLESKLSHQKLIRNYFENKNISDAAPGNKEEIEMWNLIEFITEKCENINSPLSIRQLTKDFNNHFGSSRSFDCIYDRTKKYCQEIQKAEFLDTPSKVKQLFGLSATLDSNCLEKLRKDAVVEVDNLNRITKYTANNGSLTLNGDHSRSAKRKLNRIVKRKSKKSVKKYCNSNGDKSEESEKEDGYSEEDSDEYSSEEFGSEFDSDDENGHLDETEDLTQPSNGVGDFDNETPVRNGSPTDMSLDVNFDFDPLTERSHTPEETESGQDEEHHSETTGNPSVKTRSERLPKRRHLNSEVSYNQTNSSSSEVPMSTDSLLPMSAKQKKSAIQKEQAPRSSNQSRSSPRSMRRTTRNSSIPSISTGSEKNIENQDAPRAVDYDDETLIRDPSPIEMSIDNDIDFDPSSNRPNTPGETEMGEDEEIDPWSTENAVIITKSVRLCKRKHFDSNFSNNLANSISSGTSTNTNSSSSKPTKQKKIAIDKKQASSSSNESRDPSRPIRRSIGNSSFPSISVMTDSDEKEEEELGPEDVTTRSESLSKKRVSDINSLRSQIATSPICETPESSERNAEIYESSSSRRTLASSDFNPNHSIDDPSRAEFIQKDLNVIERKNDIQQIQRPTEGLQALDEHNQLIEIPIKVEREEPAEVKPETTHNSKTKFYEAMKSLILFLDTPSLSNLQSKIYQKIRKLKGSKEVFYNNELIPAMDFMIAKITNHSTVNLPKSIESVSLSHFLCLLKAAILNSKLVGLDSLLERIRELTKEQSLQIKSVPVKTLAHVLQTTMDNIGI
ncbi:unnamed protein product [Caenorhabditis brenneri]